MFADAELGLEEIAERLTDAIYPHIAGQNMTPGMPLPGGVPLSPHMMDPSMTGTGLTGGNPFGNQFGAPFGNQFGSPMQGLLDRNTAMTSGFTPAGDMSSVRGALGADVGPVPRALAPESRVADQLLTSPPPPAQGAPVRPGQLGADMRPLDKDGDGKMDDDAVPATKEAMLDENGEPREVDTAVIIDGEEHPVTMSDPRLLEMMNTLGAANPNEPVTVLEAAEQAGYKLSSYGEILDDPTEAKPGHVVHGSKGTGFYLGDGEVLMENGQVKPLADVLELRPPNAGIFELALPELPSEEELEAGGTERTSEDDPESEPDMSISSDTDTSTDTGEEPPTDAEPTEEPPTVAEPTEEPPADAEPEPEAGPEPEAEPADAPAEQPAEPLPEPIVDAPPAGEAPPAAPAGLSASASGSVGIDLPPLAGMSAEGSAEVNLPSAPPPPTPPTFPSATSTGDDETDGPQEVSYEGRPLG